MMDQTITIGIAIVVSIVLLIAVHGWIHSLIKFNIDESAILSVLTESSDNHNTYSSEIISAKIDLSIKRVLEVCNKSKLIDKIADEKDSWGLQ